MFTRIISDIVDAEKRKLERERERKLLEEKAVLQEKLFKDALAVATERAYAQGYKNAFHSTRHCKMFNCLSKH